MGAVSGNNALLLESNSITRIRFVPKAGFSGTVSSVFTFRAWDETTGIAGQSGDYFDATTVGGSTAFSTGSDVASIQIIAGSLVNTYTVSDQQAPSMAMNASGNYVIVWISFGQDGDGNGIYAQRYSSNGVPNGLEFRVNTTTASSQILPSVAMDAAGDFVIAWQSYGQDGDGYGIYAQRYNSAGVSQGNEFLVNTTTKGYQDDASVALAITKRSPAGRADRCTGKTRNPSAFPRCFMSGETRKHHGHGGISSEGQHTTTASGRQAPHREAVEQVRLPGLRSADAAAVQYPVRIVPAHAGHDLRRHRLDALTGPPTGAGRGHRPALAPLKIHLPYHESDHVLNFAFNALCDGNCLEDLELRRQDEVYLDAVNARRIPDPTTAGDFCRRFQPGDVRTLLDVFHQTRLKVWAQQPDEFFAEARLDMDGTLVSTSGECKQGMDISYQGSWGYHPLVVTLANTGEVLSIVNRSGNRPSHEGCPEEVDQALDVCLRGGFRRVLLRGDTDFTQTRHLDRWSDDPRVRFIFGADATPRLHIRADDLPKDAWKTLQRPARYQVKTKPRGRRENVKQQIVVQPNLSTSA